MSTLAALAGITPIAERVTIFLKSLGRLVADSWNCPVAASASETAIWEALK
jgi:hypothetical protein